MIFGDFLTFPISPGGLRLSFSLSLFSLFINYGLGVGGASHSTGLMQRRICRLGRLMADANDFPAPLASCCVTHSHTCGIHVQLSAALNLPKDLSQTLGIIPSKINLFFFF